MALADAWTTRRSLQRRVELTNPDDPASTGTKTVNTTIRDAAVTDAKADFLRMTGATLDDTTPDNAHVAAGLFGVDYFLLTYRGLYGSSEVEAAERSWRNACAKIASFLPESSSLLTPSDPDTSGGAVRPEFDPENMGPLVPNPPTAGGGRTPIDFR